MEKLHLIACAIIILGQTASQAQPVITLQPTNQSVSLGASASFRVSATTTHPPALFQWRFGGSDLPAATGTRLVLTNIQLTSAGAYDVVVTDFSGSTTSQAARLEVDPAFTKITTGPVVTDLAGWAGCAWGDYDNDGSIDLFVTSTGNNDNGSLQRNALYHNNGNGAFTRVTAGSIVTQQGDWRACSWADYDNDGSLDLIVSNGVEPSGFPDQIVLYHNNGDRTFTKTTTVLQGSRIAGGASEGFCWADYDNDGFVDLYVSRYGPDWLLHNNGDGTLRRVTDDIGMSAEIQNTYQAMWGDYDNDGWPDLLVGDEPNLLYHNTGKGTFTTVLSGALVTEASRGGIWADYDNDGRLDVLTGDAQGIALYRNIGAGAFTKMTQQQTGSLAGDSAAWIGCTWGDYDNDGFLDVYLAGPDGNFLYHNERDGTFARILSGSLVNETGPAFGCSWGDYDNDGFLDLIVARGAHHLSTNLLFRNNGNSNSWVKLKLVGTLSNRSGIGAKVRVKATIDRQAVWQMREISSGGDGDLAGGLLEAHFGLGDATNIDLVRIEWPSGVVQTLTNVPPRRMHTVTEHQENSSGTIRLAPPPRPANGNVTLLVSGQPGLQYLLEASTNLLHWTKIGARTNVDNVVEFLDSKVTNFNRRFYRTSAP